MANNMEPIKGKIEIKVDTSNLQKIKEPKFVEETFKTEKGGTASVVKIVSEALTGLVDAYGKGRIRQGQGVSAKELVQMYNNNVSLHGEDVRKIIIETIQKIFSNNEFKYENGKKLYNKTESISIPEGYDSKGKRTVSFDVYKGEESKESSLGSRFLRNLDTHMEKNSYGNKVDKNFSKVIETISEERREISYQAYRRINEEFYKLKEDIYFYWQNKKDNITAELGDMNSRASEEIEAQKQKQSYEEQKYAGWSPKEDEEYLHRLMRQYEKQGRRTFKEFKGEDFFEAGFNKISKNFSNMNDLNSEFRNVLKFGKEGEIFSEIPSFLKLISPEQETIFSNLTDLSNYLMNYGKNFDRYLTLGTRQIGKEENTNLRNNFETFVSDLAISLQNFYDNNKNTFDPNFATQMQMRIQGLGKILGMIYNPDLEESQKENILDNLYNTFIYQVKGRTEKTGVYYEPNIVRSALSSQGFSVKGRYSTSEIPQFLLGNLPFFPNKYQEYENLSINDINNSNKKFSLFDNTKVRTALQLFDKLTPMINSQREGYTLSDEEFKYFNDLLNYLNMIYSNMDNLEKDVMQYEIGDNLFEKNGKFSYVGNEFTTRMAYISDRKNKLSGKSLEKAINIVKEYVNKFQNFNEKTKSDNQLEIDSINKLLQKFPERTSFISDDLEYMYEQSEDAELVDILDEIDIDAIQKTGKNRNIITKGALQQRILDLQKESSINIDYEPAKLLKELQEKQLEEELSEYFIEYSKAQNSQAKGAVTRKVNQKFGKNSEQATYFINNREHLVEEILKKQQESFNQDVDIIIENEKNQTEEIKKLSGEVYDVKTDGNGFVSSMKKKYFPDGKEYSGIGIQLGNETGFIGDWEAYYETLSDNDKKVFLEQISNIRNNLSNEQRDLFDKELSREKKSRLDIKSESLKKDLLGEQTALENLDKTYEEHSNTVLEATEAEQGKILVSENLAKALNTESLSIDKSTDSMEEHNKVIVEYEPSVYNEDAHSYISKLTGKPADLTITEAAGLAFSDFSEQSSEDFKKISQKLTDVAINGGNFSPESLGILDKNTGLVDNKRWKSIINSQSKTLLGTALHKVAEFGATYQADTLKEIKSNATPEALKEFNDTLNLISKKLKILGVELTDVDLQNFLTTYMDFFLPKGADGKRDYSKLLLAETPLMGRFSKGKESITVGGTADAWFSGQYGSRLIDFKTGNKLNSEKNTAQLSMNARLLEEAVKAGAIPEISPEQYQSIIERSILHYTNGVLTKVNYGQLSDEMIFNILQAAKSRTPIPKEQRSRYNLESQIGIESTASNSQILNKSTSNQISFTGNDKEIYKAMLKDIQKIQQAKKQIAILDAAIQNSSGDIKEDLEAQKKNQEEIVKKAEEAYELSKSQLSLDQTKEQVLESERQRAQRVNLSDAELSAASNKAYQQSKDKITNEAIKNYKTSNQSVYNQMIEVERAEMKLQQYRGKSDQEIKALQLNVQKQKEILEIKKQEQSILDGNILRYRNSAGIWQEIQLSNEEVAELQQIQNNLMTNYESKSAKVKASFKESISIFDNLVSGIKRSITNLIDYSLAGIVVGEFRQAVTQAINYTKQLDAALTDLQIAAGTTREATSAMLLEYNKLAKELGRTTQEVATASNDWLRAGYEGKEAAELTRASMELSTLGMIDSASATTDLISVMKGWKLEVDEVGSVVDKLTAIDMAAATSAGELAEAMAEGNNAARLAGASMDWYAGILAATIDTTQMGAQRVGNALTS